MSRKLIANIHLYIAAFFAPVLIITTISGGLYLLGFKGSVEKELVYRGSISEFNDDAENIRFEVDRVLKKLNIQHDFEYIKEGRNSLITRPTSREYYVLNFVNGEMKVIKQTPDIIKIIVELHKGHGPTAFKTFQKILALGLLVMLISGVWLALYSPRLRSRTIAATSFGGLVFFLLAFV